MDKDILNLFHISKRLTLSCKAIRGRIFGVGASWLGIRTCISWDKTKGHVTHGYKKTGEA